MSTIKQVQIDDRQKGSSSFFMTKDTTTKKSPKFNRLRANHERQAANHRRKNMTQIKRNTSAKSTIGLGDTESRFGRDLSTSCLLNS